MLFTMKSIFRKSAIPAFLLIFTFIMLAGCKKDNPDEPKKNSFSYNSKESVIGFAIAEIFGSTALDVYGVTFYFLENTLQWPFETGASGNEARIGDILLFTILVNDPVAIPLGTYSFNYDDGTLVNTLYERGTELMVNFNTGNGYTGTAINITGGKVVMLKTGEEYEIEMDFETDYNTKITGYYKGKIDNEDIPGKSKSDLMELRQTTEKTQSILY
jgi:hypothetical protein